MGDVLRVGMLGCGNVGAAVVRLLRDHAADIERRAGARIEIVRVAVRDPDEAARRVAAAESGQGT